MRSTHTLFLPDGPVVVTRTEVTFTFHHPCDHLPYLPPLGSTLEESTLALLRGEWLFTYSMGPSPSTTPANSSHGPSPISISTATSRSHNPPVYVEDVATLDLLTLAEQLDFDKVTPDVRPDHHTRLRVIPPAERWYAVTQGWHIGVVQGA